MGVGSVKKQKPQALKAEQVKHVLHKNNRTIVKIMQLLVRSLCLCVLVCVNWLVDSSIDRL